MKIVINACFGGFGLSEAAYEELGLEWDKSGHKLDDDRSNLQLVSTVEKLGAAASGPYANLKVVEVPDDVQWEIAEYDGSEHVAEQHRTWRATR